MKKEYLMPVIIAAAIVAVLVISKPGVFGPAGKSASRSERVDSFTLSSGDILQDRLVENGVLETVAFAVVKAFSETFDMRYLKAGDRCEAGWKGDDLSFFRYWVNATEFYTVKKVSTDTYAASREKLKLEKSVMGAEGRIETSLWDAMHGQGITDELIAKLTDIFAWQVDFLTEPRKGDTYKLIWDRYTGPNGFIKDGNILAAMYRGSESGLNIAIYFKDRYYDQDGKSMRSQFLKAPLSYRRISSYFTYKRYHPVLRRFRPHLGIDYSASAGTPVDSIGDGTVIFRGWSGGFGNFIKVRHGGGYVTTYGHLSRFRKGVRTGSHVGQGQIIGYVGSTGLSTGPHLDFRVYQYGRPINFLKIKSPPRLGLDKKDKPAFMVIGKEAVRQLASVKGNAAELK